MVRRKAESTSNAIQIHPSHIHKEAGVGMQMHRPAGHGTIWQHADQTLGVHMMETVLMNRLHA